MAPNRSDDRFLSVSIAHDLSLRAIEARHGDDHCGRNDEWPESLSALGENA